MMNSQVQGTLGMLFCAGGDVEVRVFVAGVATLLAARCSEPYSARTHHFESQPELSTRDVETALQECPSPCMQG